MADLGANSLWGDVRNGASNVQTQMMGPNYSYADNLPGPSSLGVGSNGTFGQLSTNAGAIVTYVKTMITGDPPLGNRFFVNTGGTCTAPDGSLKPRFNYIDNKPNSAGLMPASMRDVGGSFNGLIPGMVGDIASLNPVYLFNSLTSDSSPACKCYKCKVTSGGEYQFLSTNLSPDFSAANCEAVDSSKCPNRESFTTMNVPYVPLIVGVLLVLIFSGK